MYTVTFPYLVDENSEISATCEASIEINKIASHLKTSDVKRLGVEENFSDQGYVYRDNCMFAFARARGKRDRTHATPD